MSDKDGGTAFPSHEHYVADREQGGERRVITGKPHGGMSLRDWFAGEALKVTLRRESFAQGDSSLAIDIDRAYRVADAMLKERAK